MWMMWSIDVSQIQIRIENFIHRVIKLKFYYEYIEGFMIKLLPIRTIR